MLSLTAGDLDGVPAVAYVQDSDGRSETTDDHALIHQPNSEIITLADNVQGKVTFGALPGERQASFLWNDGDELRSASSKVVVEGLTSEYAVVGDSIYYSAATGGSANLCVLRYQDGAWGAPIQLTKDARYLENLSAARLNGQDYVLGMHTKTTIDETVTTEKNLVWAAVQPVSDLRLESVIYDIDAARAGEPVPVTLSVYNAGDHAVTGIDILCNHVKIQTDSTVLQPGKYADYVISMDCPETYTEYIFSVQETGKPDDDFTPSDNSQTVSLGYADVAVSLTEEQVGARRSVMATLTNEGVEPASGTLTFTDADGNMIGFTHFDDLSAGTSALSILPLAEDFSGTVTVSALSDRPEWYTYNNTATLSAVRLSEPTVICSVVRTDTQIVAQVISSESNEITAYCALYSADGKLLAVYSKPVSEGEQEITFDTTHTYASAKVVLLDGAFCPLCAAKTAA